MRLPTTVPWKKSSNESTSHLLGRPLQSDQRVTASRPHQPDTVGCSNESEDKDLEIDKNTLEGGKNFWLNLLVDHADGDSFVEVDDNVNYIEGGSKSPVHFTIHSNRRTSLLGREIEKTMSSGSPLSESSAFENPESPHGSSPSPVCEIESTSDGKNVDLTNSTSQAAPQRSRVSILQHWEKKIQANSGGDYMSDRKKNTNDQTSMTGKPSNVGGSSRRSLGDMTNRVQETITTQKLHNTDKPNSFVDNIRTVNLKPSQVKSSSSQSWYRKNEKSALLALAAVDVVPTNASSMAEEEEKPSEETTPRFVRSSQLRLEVLKPKRSDQNQFYSAYQSWRKVGLMEPTRRSIPFSQRPVTDLKPTEGHGGNQPNVTNTRDSSTRQSRVVNVLSNSSKSHNAASKDCLNTQKNSKETIGRSLTTRDCKVTDLPGQDIEETPPIESDQNGDFQHLLGMWRDQSNGKGRNVSSAAVTVVGDEDEDSFDDFRKYTSESPVRMSKIHEMSAISAASSELALVANTSHDDQLSIRSEGFIDSDEDDDESPRLTESDPVPALVILQKDNMYQIMIGESRANVTDDELVIANTEVVAHENTAMVEHKCECSRSLPRSVFSGNDDLISFFLPQMGMACSCGHQDRKNGLVKPEDPTAIENVLRPWQVQFLKSFGIHHGEQLVKARHRSGDILARALRQWRKKQGMIPFKTSSCGMALQIWYVYLLYNEKQFWSFQTTVLYFKQGEGETLFI
jgi:hypothetical protein